MDIQKHVIYSGYIVLIVNFERTHRSRSSMTHDLPRYISQQKTLVGMLKKHAPCKVFSMDMHYSNTNLIQIPTFGCNLV